MIALKVVRTAPDLVGQYVMRQPNEAGGKISLGLFYATCDENLGEGLVFDFATKQHVQTLPSRCVVVNKASIMGGVKGLTVAVPDWEKKLGTIVEESFDFRNRLQVRVKHGQGRFECSTLVKFSSVEVVIPPRT